MTKIFVRAQVYSKSNYGFLENSNDSNQWFSFNIILFDYFSFIVAGRIGDVEDNYQLLVGLGLHYILVNPSDGNKQYWFKN